MVTGDEEHQQQASALADGTLVSLCLWAVELWLPHPISRQPLHFQLPEPSIYEQIRSLESSGASSRHC